MASLSAPAKRITSALALAALLFTAAPSPVARAAQDSTVTVDNAPIRVEPRSNAKVLEYLPVGTEVRISSYPMQGGWYKIRSKTGAYGWVNEKYLSVYKPPPESSKEEVPTGPRPERDRKWFVRAFGGFDFFRPDDLNALFGFSDLNTGYYVGGEFGYFVSERVAVEFRSEALVKDLTANETLTGITFNMSIRSYPTMLGFDFYFAKLPAMRLSLGIFGGVALGTSFSTEAPSLNQPNITVLQRQPFTSLIRLNLTRPLGRILSVYMELGYRYLRTENIDTSISQGVNGGPQLYAQNGVFAQPQIDLSGIIAGVGLGIHF